MRGTISLQNVDREEAYSEFDLRLLNTLAGTMSVALENARLFDETERLLNETEQRAGELAIINGMSQVLTQELDLQAMLDLVGDKLRAAIQTAEHRHRPVRQAIGPAQLGLRLQGRRAGLPRARPIDRLQPAAGPPGQILGLE